MGISDWFLAWVRARQAAHKAIKLARHAEAVGHRSNRRVDSVEDRLQVLNGVLARRCRELESKLYKSNRRIDRLESSLRSFMVQSKKVTAAERAELLTEPSLN
jgi:hypothetical protein